MNFRSRLRRIGRALRWPIGFVVGAPLISLSVIYVIDEIEPAINRLQRHQDLTTRVQEFCHDLVGGMFGTSADPFALSPDDPLDQAVAARYGEVCRLQRPNLAAAGAGTTAYLCHVAFDWSTPRHPVRCPDPGSPARCEPITRPYIDLFGRSLIRAVNRTDGPDLLAASSMAHGIRISTLLVVDSRTGDLVRQVISANDLPAAVGSIDTIEQALTYLTITGHADFGWIDTLRSQCSRMGAGRLINDFLLIDVPYLRSPAPGCYVPATRNFTVGRNGDVAQVRTQGTMEQVLSLLDRSDLTGACPPIPR